MSKIKLEVDMRMKCELYGAGKIDAIHYSSSHPIRMAFSNSGTCTYTEAGKMFANRNPTLKLLNIPFTEGLEVECDIYGSGVVSHINNDPIKPIGVKFDIDLVAYYTASGCISPNANQTLYPKFTI